MATMLLTVVSALLLVCLVQADINYALKVLLPGTKWCGPGDKAKNYDDLGLFDDTDRCCREHDHCPEHIGQNEKRGGVENKGAIPYFPCFCDDGFRKCLLNVNSHLSHHVGTAYFKFSDGCYVNSTKNSGQYDFIKAAKFPCRSSGFFINKC